jgi:SHS2 domain-containing protein
MVHDRPLGQRKNGRRSKTRSDEGSSGIFEKSTNITDSSHCPAPEVQQQIEAAILTRSQLGLDGKVFLDDKSMTKNERGLENIIDSYCFTTNSGYVYMDHTADVQLHAWGDTFGDALSELAISMFGYMTTLSAIEVDDDFSKQVASEVEASGHDLKSLVYSFLNEWLFIFHSVGFVAKKVKIVEIDRERYSIKSSGKGEKMNISKHPQGTEVKAITYSNMQLNEESDGRCKIWVIIDI